MNNDFVYSQIYKGALNAGAKDEFALSAALTGLDDYKKGRYDRKVLDLIELKIKEAKRLSKNASK